jgi:hypothetical protein
MYTRAGDETTGTWPSTANICIDFNDYIFVGFGQSDIYEDTLVRFICARYFNLAGF